MRIFLTCLVVFIHLFIAINACLGEETVASRLRQAKALALDKPKDALSILSTCMNDIDDGASSVEAAEVAATILKTLNKIDEAIHWCEWGMQKAKYFNLDDNQTATLRQLQKTLFTLRKAERRQKEIEAEGEDAILFREAMALEEASDYKTAHQKYQLIRDKFAKSKYIPQSMVGSSRCLLWQWKLAECQTLTERFVGDDPNGLYRDQAHLILGDLFLIGYCKASEAKVHYETAKKMAGDGREGGKDTLWRAEQHLAILAYIFGDRKQALELLRKSKEMMGETNPSLEREVLGIQVLEGFLEENQSPTPAWVFSEGDPSARVALILGDVWYEMLDFERAVSAYALAVDNSALGKKASKDQKAYALMQQALICDNTFKAEKSEKIYRDILDSYGNCRVVPHVKLRLGCLLYNQTERHEEASKIWEEMADRHPNHPKAEYTIYLASWGHAADGRMTEARRIFNKIQANTPNSIWLPVLLHEFQLFEAKKKK